MAEYIFGLAIFIFVSIVMVAIGIAQVRSKEPVGFYTGEKPIRSEQISDVKEWNKKHGFMWILYGVAIIGSYIICSFVNSETISGTVLIATIVGALPIMMFYHSYLKKRMYEIDK